jgi:hypothetical protein
MRMAQPDTGSKAGVLDDFSLYCVPESLSSKGQQERLTP